jgi:hypothetical protein
LNTAQKLKLLPFKEKMMSRFAHPQCSAHGSGPVKVGDTVYHDAMTEGGVVVSLSKGVATVRSCKFGELEFEVDSLRKEK